MELPIPVEESVHRVATRSSTSSKVSKVRKPRNRPRRKRGIPESEDSLFDPVSDPESPPIATTEKGVETDRIPTDISAEVQQQLKELGSYPDRSPRKARFDDTPVIIRPDRKPDDYDIIQDIKDQQANVTIGQLLHDNTNYQKLIREEWTKRRKKRHKLPSVAVNFSEAEDYGAPELVVEVEGCIIPKVPVDGGFGVNLMLEDTAFDLGYTSFEETDLVLRMADQSRVVPAGRFSQVPTRIGEVTYLQNFVIIRVNSGRPFSMLLGRPWLYSAKVVVDWGTREFVLGKPPTRIPWEKEKYLGDTSETDGYTSGWSSADESDSVATYLVNQFSEVSETDCGFRNPIQEDKVRDDEFKPGPDSVQEDRSLGEASLPLTIEWIKKQIQEGTLPSGGLDKKSLSFALDPNPPTSEEVELDQIKNVVNPKDYEETEVAEGRSFFLGKNLDKREREGYTVVLKEFSDIFAWTPSDLTGIPSHLEEHRIDLIDGSVPIRQ